MAFLRDQPDSLVDAILVADESTEFSLLIAALRPHAAAVQPRLLDEIGAAMPVELDKANRQLSADEQQRRDTHWLRQSMAAVTLVDLGLADNVWPLLEFISDPSLRSYIIHHLGKLNTDHNRLAGRLKLEEDNSICRALIQSLGGINAALIQPTDRSRIAEQLKRLYVEHPDSGVHSSASWTLRQWGVTLPELAAGKPTLTDEQKEHISQLTSKVESIQQRIAAAEIEIPVRQAVWEQTIREQAATVRRSLNNGLIAHFPLDETDGKLMSNAVDGQPNGEYKGSGEPQWQPGVLVEAVRFDGKGGYVDCGEAFLPQQDEPFSFACWFYVDSLTSRGNLLGKYDPSNARGMRFDVAKKTILCEWHHHYPDNALTVMGELDLVANSWYQLIVCYDGSSSGKGVAIYVNGRAVALNIYRDSLTKSISNGMPLTLGGGASLYRHQGGIDDVRIYDRLLTKEEVEQMYEAGLRAVIDIPSETRKQEHQAFLSAAWHPLDEPLRRLESQLVAAEMTLREASWDGVRRWYVNGQGQTMLVIPDPSGLGGSDMDHSFAIASHEVTVAEFRRFLEQQGVNENIAPTEECPVNSVSWYQAAAYCNWLSEQEGIPADQYVYEPNSKGQYAAGMLIRENAAELIGYRLPTDPEWVLACRAGSSSSYSFGEPLALLARYARYLLNSSGHSSSVGSLLPNTLGIFDMHGNVWEWTLDPTSGPISPVHSARVLKAGAFSSLPEIVRSHGYSVYRPEARMGEGGFRPARTYHLFP